MIQFKYAAKDTGGQTVQGIIQAASKAEAVAELRKRALVVLQLDESSARQARSLATLSVGKVKPRAKAQEVVVFTRQLATMIGAGLSLLESLEVLGAQAETPGMRATCEVLVTEVRGGADLSSAMQRCPKVFDHLYVSMVKAGEVSGQMDVILNRLAGYQEETAELRREIKSAMTYPVISMILVVGITMFLMVGVVPTFKGVFDSMELELPAITKAVLATSDWMLANMLLIPAGAAGIAAGVAFLKKTRQGRLVWDHMLLRLPVFGGLLRKVCLARFSRTFATLIRSGVPILSTLDIVSDTAGNAVVAEAVVDARESVRVGQQLSDPLSKRKVFPPMVTRMIAIGERTGALETLLEKIADFYDSQVKAMVKSLTSLIEPLLITFMGVIVGGVVLSIFAPIMSLIEKLSTGG
ncbi:MAG: type II secretion system F family protein, partial [Planctomycetota bacterium]|nr:type II secretion system F family protein [Planctomycetota bacterium]